ncbi:hypothetical protein P4O66_008857 [Electrophorus voltai]|uniref:Uncharacterized protein n=1 Tax=Electrophorus voltai TaxID=2609070 RepID=A0AAD9DWT0_9TELE|nr:hypothetical protein P4O66_008857 [Electrophorus voltai]
MFRRSVVNPRESSCSTYWSGSTSLPEDPLEMLCTRWSRLYPLSRGRRARAYIITHQGTRAGDPYRTQRSSLYRAARVRWRTARVHLLLHTADESRERLLLPGARAPSVATDDHCSMHADYRVVTQYLMYDAIANALK